jgi:predicted nucleic acid-binding protein
MTVFVDTGAWFARFVPDDPNHSLVVAWFASNNNPLVTSDYCVDETLTLICARKRSQLALVAGKELFNESISQLHFLTTDEIRRSWILFQQRAAAGWSFTDCTSKIIVDDLDIETVATFDSHFHQFGITVVP